MLSDTERRVFDARFDALFAIDPTKVIKKGNRHGASITEVEKGGVLRFRHDVFVVTDVATCTETDEKYKKHKDYFSTEFTLYSLKTGETRYLEWEKDDDVEISLTERKLKRAELRSKLTYSNGEPVDLDDMDDVADDGTDLVFEGKVYSYDDDWPARYVSQDGRTGNVYIYEFGDASQQHWLTIEAWQEEGGGEDFEVFVSSNIKPAEIEIISLG